MKGQIFYLIIIVFCSCVQLNGCNCQTALEGSWVGCEIRKPFIEWTLVIEGNRFSLMREDFRQWYKGHLKLNSNCPIKKIDFQIEETGNHQLAGKTLLGIYEVEEEILTFITSGFDIQERPLSFESADETMAFNFVRTRREI